MNRKSRRAAIKNERRNAVAPRHDTDIDDLFSEAGRLYQQGQFLRAQEACRLILAREPSHAAANNLRGVIFQALRRDRIAIEHFTKAIALEPSNALFQYNIAFSYQRLDSWDDAVAHFTKAIELKMDGRPIEDLIAQYPVIASCLNRIAQQWPRRLTMEALFGDDGVAAVANDAFLRCALENTQICSLELEGFLASIRFALLQIAVKDTSEPGCDEDRTLGFFSAVAQQCFIDEYLLAPSDDESRQAENLRSLVVERLATGGAISELLLITVATYFPLHSLPATAAQWERDWPRTLNGLLRQQLVEPLEEIRLRGTIRSLTAIEDDVSVKVRQQYEENPYPRWTVIPDVSTVSDWRTRFPVQRADRRHEGPLEILIAGCGTGQNSIQAALKFPEARVLAVDLSSTSLAYALRKTREAGIQNIDYGQADILKLDAIGRSFDRIEAVGVLHHLDEPSAGWRVLLSLLRPGGIMDVGLYSETARRAVVEARTLIAARGYRPSTEDIRLFRRELSLTNGTVAKDLVSSPDFYSTSGCRDLLFHIREHRFTIPEIAAFLRENNLAFLGFRLGAEVFDRFRIQFPDPDAVADLDCWHSFEQDNRQTFSAMYRFAVRKKN
jgi:2-polyprenyl-3-methyl-5-hydroxy-6-metoxy-1,4-benzoquinol methylase